MTLCVVWRDRDTLHIAADSYVSTGTDLGPAAAVKVTRRRYAIVAGQGDDGAPAMLSGDVAFCFAGGGPEMRHLKQALTATFDKSEPISGHDDIGFEGVARIAFSAYRAITRILHASTGRRGFYRVIVAGHCFATSTLRSFRLSTEWVEGEDGVEPHHAMDELLRSTAHVFIGDGGPAARQRARQHSLPLSTAEILDILQGVIDDPHQIGVTGAIQYGRFEGPDFKLFEVMDRTAEADFWGGTPNLHARDFDAAFAIGYPMIPLDAPAP